MLAGAATGVLTSHPLTARLTRVLSPTFTASVITGIIPSGMILFRGGPLLRAALCVSRPRELVLPEPRVAPQQGPFREGSQSSPRVRSSLSALEGWARDDGAEARALVSAPRGSREPWPEPSPRPAFPQVGTTTLWKCSRLASVARAAKAVVQHRHPPGERPSHPRLGELHRAVVAVVARKPRALQVRVDGLGRRDRDDAEG